MQSAMSDRTKMCPTWIHSPFYRASASYILIDSGFKTQYVYA